jgi:hypothetical protein
MENKIISCGSVSHLLKDVKDIDKAKKHLMGKPINNAEGNKIGEISFIDGDTWYGYLNVYSMSGTQSEMAMLKETYGLTKVVSSISMSKHH